MKNLPAQPISSHWYREQPLTTRLQQEPTDTYDTSFHLINSSLAALLNQSPCVTWILDIRTQQFDFISENTREYFGYGYENYLLNGYRFHQKTKHPDDITNTSKLMDCVWNELSKCPSNQRKNYKFSFDYRILKPDGKAIRILEQNTVFQNDASGDITHLLGTCNDITQWKRNGTQLASLASSINQQYFLFTAENTAAARPQSLLSKRELEIVKLISEGRSSKYIADKLFISFHTVNTHRQKMIEKTGTKNTGELVQFAARNGLI